MKVIKFQVMEEHKIGTEDAPEIIRELVPYEMGYSEKNCETARSKAYNGEYTIEDDGEPDPPPTTEQRVSDLEEQLVQADETAIALYEAQEAQEVINAQQDEALMELYEMKY